MNIENLQEFIMVVFVPLYALYLRAKESDHLDTQTFLHT